MPLIVSVIIAAYNAEAFVATAIRSALDQTMPDLEVIVVDDGSSDGTVVAATAAAAGDPRFRLIACPANAGASAARNVALRNANGRWIAVLDADDAFVPERLQRLVEVAERLSADLLADNITFVGPGARPVKGFAAPAPDPRRPIDARRFIALDRPGLRALPAGYMQPLMRRAFLVRFAISYPEEIRCGEDFELYVRCLLRGARLFIVPQSYYRALVRPDSLSRAHQERNMTFVMRSNARLITEALRLKNHGAAQMLERRGRALTSYVEYSRLSEALHQRRAAEAWRLFRRIFAQPYTWRRFALAACRRFSGRNAA